MYEFEHISALTGHPMQAELPLSLAGGLDWLDYSVNRGREIVSARAMTFSSTFYCAVGKARTSRRLCGVVREK